MTDTLTAALRAESAVLAAYKERDKAIAAVCLAELGIEVPNIFFFTDPETGTKYAIYVYALLRVVEKGVPSWAQDEGTHLTGEEV